MLNVIKNKKPKSNSQIKVNIKNVKTKKPTHLYLNDKCLTAFIMDNGLCPDNLSVIYLHENNITKIENLDAAVNLKSLYLQKNKISKIENLQNLKKLKQLYLGHNDISVVEGLENLEHLQEFHIEKQRNNLDSICFDSRSIEAIANSLEVLNVSNNNITDIESLLPLKYLTSINVSYNKLYNIRNLCDALYNWGDLYEANFIGNPVTKQKYYRETLISYTTHLVLLDKKEINDTTRCFIKRFEQAKLNQSSKQAINLTEKVPEIAKNYSMPIQKAVSEVLRKNIHYIDTSMMHGNVDDMYLAWNSLPKAKQINARNVKPTQKQTRAISTFVLKKNSYQ